MAVKIGNNNNNKGSWKDGSVGKQCLLHKHEGLSTHVKIPDKAARITVTSVLLGQVKRIPGTALGSMRDPISEK